MRLWEERRQQSEEMKLRAGAALAAASWGEEML
jgi:hypothetical protein